MAAEIPHAKSLHHTVQKKSKNFFRQFSEVIKKDVAFTKICYALSHVDHIISDMISMARGVQFASINPDFLCLCTRKHPREAHGLLGE